MINSTEFGKVLDTLLGNQNPDKIAVAVSGGADSLCLTFLLQEWTDKNGVELYAFTVDHGLRSESAKEARYVHRILTQKGIYHKTLVWKGKKPTHSVEEKARQARYDLLLRACAENKIAHLCLAHHQDDQAETFWLRLIRSSGVDGLSAMQPVSVRNGISLLRPLLGFSRAQIQKTLEKRFAVQWVEDPSNQQSIFERVRLRQFQKQLDSLGLNTAAVALSAKRLQRARKALEWMTDNFIEQSVQKNSAGFAFVDGAAFDKLPDEIRLRVLDKLLAYVAGENYAPRMAQLEKMLQQMPCRLTLSDCQIVSVKKGFYVCPEYAKLPSAAQIKAGKNSVWGRFLISSDANITVAPLGDNLKVKTLPALVRRTIPAFFDKKGLAIVPALDYKREDTHIKVSIQVKE